MCIAAQARGPGPRGTGPGPVRVGPAYPPVVAGPRPLPQALPQCPRLLPGAISGVCMLFAYPWVCMLLAYPVVAGPRPLGPSPLPHATWALARALNQMPPPLHPAAAAHHQDAMQLCFG